MEKEYIPHGALQCMVHHMVHCIVHRIVHHMVSPLTSTFLMYTDFLIKSLLTIRSASLDVEGAKLAWHALTVALQPLTRGDLI